MSNNKRGFKLLSAHEENTKKRRPKISALCLTKYSKNKRNAGDTGNLLNNSLLTDDESDGSFEGNAVQKKSNPIFSSSESANEYGEKQKVVNQGTEEEKEHETFCSELEKPADRDGSESLFSSEDQIGEKNDNRLSQLMLGERFTGIQRLTGSSDGPLLLESSSCSSLKTTLNKDSEYLEYMKEHHISSGSDLYQEKGQVETPEKTADNISEIALTCSELAKTEKFTVSNASVMNTSVKAEFDEVLTISSAAYNDNNASILSPEGSVIILSDSESEQNLTKMTKASSELSAVVSPILGVCNETASSEIDRFFNDVPLLSTPECTNYMNNFDPRRQNGSQKSESTKGSKNIIIAATEIEDLFSEIECAPKIQGAVDGEKEIIKESEHVPKIQDAEAREEVIIEESDPEPDSQPNLSLNQTLSAVKSTSDAKSVEDKVIEINISAKIHVTIKNKATPRFEDKREPEICTPVVSQTPVSFTQRLRDVSNRNGNKSHSPQPGPSKLRQTEQTHQSRKNSNTKTLKDVRNEYEKESNNSIEVDDFTSDVLNEIYGKDQWQTPQLKVKTAKKSSKDTTDVNFNNFNDNACAESTRINFVHHNPPTSPKQSSLQKTTNKGKERQLFTTKKNIRPALAICDSDTSFDSNSIDEEFTHQLNSNFKDKQYEKHRPAYKRVVRPPSYSGFDDDINEIWTDKNAKSPLNNALDNCEYKSKEKIPPTPNTGIKTKRKLFNPNKSIDMIDPVPNDPIRDMDYDISHIDDDSLSFQIPILPKAIDKIRDKLPTQTPTKTTPKTQAKKKLQPSTKDYVGIENKLGFLQSLDVNTAEHLCDPQALRFRQNYKKLKEELTDKLFSLYNQHIFQNALVAPCTWNKKLLNTAGRCHLSRVGGLRKSRIELSDKVLTSADRLRCTLIHEMCHAATWNFNGEDGHGKTWKAWAHKANSVFKELPKINTCHSYEIFHKYTYMCTLCKAKSQAHSKNKKVESIRCKMCHGSIEILLNKIDKDGNVVSTPVKQASGFSKYVKENYSKVKKPNIPHGDVMRLLGEEFGKLSVEEKKIKFN